MYLISVIGTLLKQLEVLLLGMDWIGIRLQVIDELELDFCKVIDFQFSFCNVN